MADKLPGIDPASCPERLPADDAPYAAFFRLHEDACRAGKDSYFDPATGYSVFTCSYLLNMGQCCMSGCRHCPYHADDKDHLQ